MVRLLVVIFPNKSLGSLDTYLTRERENCEAISRAASIYKVAKAFYDGQRIFLFSLWGILVKGRDLSFSLTYAQNRIYIQFIENVISEGIS